MKSGGEIDRDYVFGCGCYRGGVAVSVSFSSLSLSLSLSLTMAVRRCLYLFQYACFWPCL